MYPSPCIVVEEAFQHVISLRYLRLYKLPQLTALPEWIQHLPMLQSLQIVWCKNLRMFPVWLQFLRIGNCNHDIHRLCEKVKGEDWHIISHIPDCYIDDPEEEAPSTSVATMFSSTSTGRMHSSTTTFNLSATCYNELELNSREVEEDLQHLISLRDLELKGLPRLTALPEWIQHLPRLQSLSRWECNNLTRVPDWLQRITTLQSLEIRDCNRELHRRCKKDKGEDWHIISRIPDVVVYIRDPEEEAASTSGAGCSSVIFNKFRRNTCLNSQLQPLASIPTLITLVGAVWIT